MRTISPLPQLVPMIWKGFPWRIPAQARLEVAGGVDLSITQQHRLH